MNDDESLSFCVEFTVLDGLWLAGFDVAHVLIGDLCGAQRELGQDVGVIRHPLSGGRQWSGCAVYCFNTETQSGKHHWVVVARQECCREADQVQKHQVSVMKTWKNEVSLRP